MKTPWFPVLFSVLIPLFCLCLERQNVQGPPAPPIDTLFAAVGDVVINEVCASNAGNILDEDFDDPDWIELYNRGDTAVNLKG